MQQQQAPHLAGRPSSSPHHSNPHSSPSSHMQSSVVGGGVGVGSHGSASPSKVLHIRGLPPYTSENDVLSFFASLPAQSGGGGVSLTRILLLPNSNQAFVQLPSVSDAVHLVSLQAAQGGHFVIKGNKSIIVQFSNRQEIHTPATIAAAAGGQGGAAAGPAAGAQHADYAKGGGGSGGVGNDSQQTANSILIVTVLNTRVPVTLDHIHQIFKVRRNSLLRVTHPRTANGAAERKGQISVAVSARSRAESVAHCLSQLFFVSRCRCPQPYGDVLKIITFHKQGVFKALVQLSSVEAAINARSMLEGKDIFQVRAEASEAENENSRCI